MYRVTWKGVVWLEDLSCCSLCKTENLAREKSRARLSKNEIQIEIFMSSHLIDIWLSKTLLWKLWIFSSRADFVASSTSNPAWIKAKIEPWSQERKMAAKIERGNSIVFQPLQLNILERYYCSNNLITCCVLDLDHGNTERMQIFRKLLKWPRNWSTSGDFLWSGSH